MTASSTWLHQAHDCRILEKDQAVLATQLPGQKNLSLRLWIEIAIEKAFWNIENNYFCMKSTLFKPWNVLILMQNCRHVRFSNDIWTLMTPLNIQYDKRSRASMSDQISIKSATLQGSFFDLSLRLWIEIAIEKAFSNVENNYFCMKSTLFKPWNVLILMQNCRDVRFSKDIWTLMTPLNTRYDNAPALLWPSNFRPKPPFFKAYFASACLKITDFT